jgi:hypothetical protein
VLICLGSATGVLPFLVAPAHEREASIGGNSQRAESSPRLDRDPCGVGPKGNRPESAGVALFTFGQHERPLQAPPCDMRDGGEPVGESPEGHWGSVWHGFAHSVVSAIANPRSRTSIPRKSPAAAGRTGAAAQGVSMLTTRSNIGTPERASLVFPATTSKRDVRHPRLIWGVGHRAREGDSYLILPRPE